MNKRLHLLSKQIPAGLLFFLFVAIGSVQSQQEEGIPLAPRQNRRPDNIQRPPYKSSLDEGKETFSGNMMQLAAHQYETVKKVNSSGKWKPTPESIDSHPAPEWFKDAKFGMFIDWGLWSIAGWAPKKENGAMYPDWYEYRLDTDTAFIAYHEKNWGKDFKRDDFIPLFTAKNYHPEQLAEIAREAGMKYIIPFCKHHGGFCLWPSSFTQRDAGDMGPHRDLIQPLVESCREKGLKFGFYFSIEEWEYPILDTEGRMQIRMWGNDIKPYTLEIENKCTGKIAVNNYALEYLVPQATEFIDKYDPDILWYDGDWNTNVEAIHAYDIASYFYNQAEGRKEVAVNDRYGGHVGEKWQRSKRGDFFTNEYGDMEKEAKQAIHAWEECRGISQSFGYNWQDTDENVITSKAFIDMFVEIVAHGGNLLLVVNLNEQGALPNVQENRLKDIGKWLAVNGEGIYATRPFYPYVDGTTAYTQSKEGHIIYAILKEWPGKELNLKGIHPVKDSKISMLGCDHSFDWIQTNNGILVKFPDTLQNERNRPCKYAWILKISPLLLR